MEGCGRSGESHPASVDALAALRAERNARLAATPQDWPSRHDCDALLWAGLAKAAGVHLDLSEAESEPGRMHRRPLSSGECYPVESASTISNDMLWGYLLAADRAALERLADYGQGKNWVMGAPFPEMAARVLAKPNLVVAIGRRLGRWYGTPPCTLTPPVKDFERHLHLLAGIACGQRPDIVADDPADALARAVAGDLEGAAALLLDPNYREPSYVRGSDAYANVHWLFAAAVVLGEVR